MAALAPCITPTVKQSKSSCSCPFSQECERFPISSSSVELCVCLTGQNCVPDHSSCKGGWERDYLAKNEAYICHSQNVLRSVRGTRGWMMGRSQESLPYWLPRNGWGLQQSTLDRAAAPPHTLAAFAFSSYHDPMLLGGG